jgi:inhibitor of KinA sporulation pathway (predicted exonuclease)
MNLMVLDAEYNQPSRKTIQIGAAVFNARNAALIDRIEIYVNPGEPITELITRLTGIRDQDVSNGMSIEQAYEELKRFHAKHKCFRNPLVWGSGYRNDSLHIYQEYRESLGLPLDTDIQQTENFMGFRVIDVKTIYQSTRIFENTSHAGGLKDCMRRLGMVFEGEEHRALTDAINTFRVWYHLMRIFHDGTKVKQR